MNGTVLIWLIASTAVFVSANGVLKSYATSGDQRVLVGALLLFCLGNVMIVQVMRASGLGVAIALSSIFQLMAVMVVATVVFEERPTALQLSGIVLGVVAVAMIAWPKGGAA